MKISVSEGFYSNRWSKRWPKRWLVLAGLAALGLSACSYNNELAINEETATAVKSDQLAAVTQDSNTAGGPAEYLVDPSPERLVLAARYGQINTLRYLLDGGLDINVKDAYGNTALIAAAGNGQREIVTELLSRGARIDIANAVEQTALMGAAAKGDYQLVHRLIQSGARVDLKNNQGETALFLAVGYGHHMTAVVLLNAGANPNLANSVRPNLSNSGYTPLIYAATGGLTKEPVDWPAMTRLLLDNGANPELLDSHGESALNLARSNNNQDVVAVLLDAGAKDNQGFVALSANDALIKAAKLGGLYQIEQSLNHGADANYVDPNGITPLLAAAFEGQLEAVKRLLQAGAEVNFVPTGLRQFALAKSHAPLAWRDLMTAASRGDTALIAAARRGHLEVVDLLFQRGAEVELSNHHGETPLLNAAAEGNTVMVKMLLSYGANPNALEQDNRSNRLAMAKKSMGSDSVLIKAVRNGFLDVAALLIEAGADINYRGYMGKTSLYVAVEEGRLNLLELILANDGNPDVASVTGITPLMEAAKSGNPKLSWALLAGGADVNAIERPDLGYAIDSQGSDSMTALMFASRGGHEDVVQMLLQAGAEANIHNADGKSAYDEASERGFEKVTQLLRAAGSRN